MMNQAYSMDNPSFSNEKLASFLQEEMGFDLSRVDLSAIVDAVKKEDLSLGSFDDFSSAVSSLIAVHETYFLRHHEQFEWIEKIWLPHLLNRLNGRTSIRILSAGCSTGEEPYSIYAHLQPYLQSLNIKLEIDAVDVSDRAMDIAKKGRYGLWSMRGVNAEHEATWLDVKSRNVQVKDWVREGVNFFRHNLTQPFPMHMLNYYDLVLCRNVMIYMHTTAVKNIYGNLLTVMNDQGLIMPGPSDPNPEESLDLQVKWQAGVRLYEKKKPADTNADVADTKPAWASSTWVNPIKKTTVSEDSSFIKTVDNNAPIKLQSSGTTQDYALIESMMSNCLYDAARKALEANIASDPLDVRSYVLLAVMALDLDEVQLALYAIRKAVFLKPNALYVVYLMANYKHKVGDAAGARKELLWLKKELELHDETRPVEYCEELLIAELKGVVDARIRQ